MTKIVCTTKIIIQLLFYTKLNRREINEKCGYYYLFLSLDYT